MEISCLENGFIHCQRGNQSQELLYGGNCISYDATECMQQAKSEREQLTIVDTFIGLDLSIRSHFMTNQCREPRDS